MFAEALAADQNYLLGQWIADAAQWGNGDPAVTAQWVYGARNQITLWGPDGTLHCILVFLTTALSYIYFFVFSGEINDYAAKNGWSGLISGYYLKRWDILYQAAMTSIATGTAIDYDTVSAETFAFEQKWCNQTDDRPPTVASGEDPTTIAAVTIGTVYSFKYQRILDIL